MADHYGWTCGACPSRGSRSVVGDFVAVPFVETTESEELHGSVLRTTNWGYRTESVGYPDRCDECNRRYAAHKRAREAGLRLELVRHEMQVKEGEKWRHLKFVTCTWPSEWTETRSPDLVSFKAMWAKARATVARRIGAVGGTDVIEVVTKHDEATGLWRHHIHTHGLWCAPFVRMDDLRSAMDDAGIGRFEYTVLRERSWEDDAGDVRTKDAIWCAIDYLAKYLTKCQGTKRQVWGELRSWKEYLGESVCRVCVKTTRQAKDYQQCNCETETHVRAG